MVLESVQDECLFHSVYQHNTNKEVLENTSRGKGESTHPVSEESVNNDRSVTESNYEEVKLQGHFTR